MVNKVIVKVVAISLMSVMGFSHCMDSVTQNNKDAEIVIVYLLTKECNTVVNQMQLALVDNDSKKQSLIDEHHLGLKIAIEQSKQLAVIKKENDLLKKRNDGLDKKNRELVAKSTGHPVVKDDGTYTHLLEQEKTKTTRLTKQLENKNAEKEKWRIVVEEVNTQVEELKKLSVVGNENYSKVVSEKQKTEKSLRNAEELNVALNTDIRAILDLKKDENWTSEDIKSAAKALSVVRCILNQHADTSVGCLLAELCDSELTEEQKKEKIYRDNKSTVGLGYNLWSLKRKIALIVPLSFAFCAALWVCYQGYFQKVL